MILFNLNDYISLNAMTTEEEQLLREWLSEGNSHSCNPWWMTDESGKELDFHQAFLIVQDLASGNR